MASVNPIRGEAAVRLGGVEIVMVATMDSLARLSTAIGNPTLADIYHRLTGSEPAATLAAIRTFTERGTGDGGKALKREEAVRAALAEYSLADNEALQGAFLSLLTALIRERPEGEAPSEGN